jgi:hypothetical protein
VKPDGGESANTCLSTVKRMSAPTSRVRSRREGRNRLGGELPPTPVREPDERCVDSQSGFGVFAVAAQRRGLSVCASLSSSRSID